MKKFRSMLYHERKRDGLIFTDKELYDAAIKEGWTEVPEGHPAEKKPKVTKRKRSVKISKKS